MRKILILLLALISASAVYSQTQQQVAVYVTGGEEDGINEFIGAYLVTAIVKSSNYTAVERTADFLRELNKEQDYQRTGNVQDSQILELGHQFGVQLVCVAQVGKVGKEVTRQFISVRLIDVETVTVKSSTKPLIFTIENIEESCATVATMVLSSINEEYADAVLKRCENLVKSGDYQKALDTMNSVWNIIIPEDKNKIIRKKKDEIDALIKEQKIQDEFNKCNNYYRNNQFEEAKECYEQQVRNKHPEAKKMLDSTIHKMIILNIMNSRDTTIHTYRKLQPAAFSSLTETISQNINKFINSTKKGEFKLTLLINFDIQQKDTSSVNIIADEEAFKKEPFYYDFITRLRLLYLPTLSPPLIENIPVNATDKFIVPLRWNSEQITVVRKFEKPPTIEGKKDFGRFQDIILSKFNTNRQYAATGRYTFVVKTKYVFDANFENIPAKYTDISLKKFYTVGPEAMLYSMICPGAGNLVATQGKKGWGSLFTTLIFAGLGSAAILQTKTHYLPIDAKYDKYMQYGAYTSFGIAGIIWTVDIFKALSRGCKNLKSSKELRQELRKREQSIVREPIVIE
jgi:tetratricopeptide (TPR) repeat protein